MKSCSFTGHRFIPKTHEKALESLLNRAIDYLYNEGIRDFYCGGALGFDTMAAKQLILKRMKNRDIKLILLLPCKNQDLKFSEIEKQMYSYILSSADEIVVLSEEYTPTCMKKRNKALVDACDVLVSYAFKKNSGASQTIRMAIEQGKTVYNLYSKCKALSMNN